MRRCTHFIGGLVCLIFVSSNCFATTWYVNPGQSIQDAIDSSTHGDTVIVSPGTYYENIFFNGKNIVLTSTDPDSPVVVAATIIDGNDSGSVVTFDGSEKTTCVLAGFTIQNGEGTLYDSHYIGGGIYGSNCCATIQNNTIISNSPQGHSDSSGGGLAYCDGTIQYNTISGNRAISGGGLSFCDGTIQNNTITENWANHYGGGLYNCQGTIQNNTIAGNYMVYEYVDPYGGGLSFCDGKIQNNTTSGNLARYGGGLAYCDGTIQENAVSGNSASWNGGGLYECDGMIQHNIICGNSVSNSGGGLSGCDGTIQNNTICGNSADDGGGLVTCDGTILNNTIIGNLVIDLGGGLRSCNGILQNNNISGNSADRGGGLAWCTSTIINSIIWGNTAPNGSQLYSGAAPTSSCIQDWSDGGEGNISSYPIFAGYSYDTGTWTANAVYDTGMFQSTLTDTGAAWPINSLAGMFLRPDTGTVFQFPIVSNTDTTITVWCDLSNSVQAGDHYEIYDYHLQAGSPCIDSGYRFADAGEYDLDGNPRYVDASDSSGWDGVIKAMVVDDDNTVHLAWALIDMGAYEYQIACTPLKFTLQSRDALNTGSWQDRYTGFAGTWTDTEAGGPGMCFYRVIGDYAVEQLVVGISAPDALAMLDERFGEECFTVLDVRTPGEYATRHIIGAVNIDFYSPTFTDQLNALDKGRAYLVHCASGFRSAQAVQAMEALGFVEVCDLLGGMSAFQSVPGADMYLEP